ncbi:conserved Plasmodium protein, unknown function [Plasmodium vivax]|uniref:S1 motif domain-containing protein n=1 Tax=Plasmodium vivax TaxID=5855 RepID=A0A1G4H8L4_PLAVI|nr:conserved Plasmodium protein, unknown function [Plasmodium vivax]
MSEAWPPPHTYERNDHQVHPCGGIYLTAVTGLPTKIDPPWLGYLPSGKVTAQEGDPSPGVVQCSQKSGLNCNPSGPPSPAPLHTGGPKMKVAVTALTLFLFPTKGEAVAKYTFIASRPRFPLQSGREGTHTNVGRKKKKKKNQINQINQINISGNDLFEYFVTLSNEEDKMNEERKKKKKNYSVTYIQKLPKKNLLLKRWKYDLYEKIKEKMKRDQQLMSRTKVCRHKYKLPVDFFKLGDQVRGKIVQVEDHLIKLDINALNFAHLYIKRYSEEKAQLRKKFQVGKHIDVVICYIHRKNGIIQVTDNEEEIKALRRGLQKLRDAGVLRPRTGEAGEAGEAGEVASNMEDSLEDSPEEPPSNQTNLPPGNTANSANTANAVNTANPVTKELGVEFRTNEEGQDLMYVKEESASGKKKNITHFKIEDTVSGVVKYINEEGAYIDIGCKTLAFLNLGHYNKDPKSLVKEVKKKKISIGDYLRNLKVRKVDVLSQRLEVTLYSQEEEACLRVLNQQETLKEQNKYMPCPSYVTHNYHMINYLKKYNELKKKKKKNVHNLFDKKEQLNEFKKISHLKKSQFAPFMLRYNELTSPNSNYEDMLEQHADNEQFLQEIGALPSPDDEQVQDKFSLESLKKQNKALRDEIERFREGSSNTDTADTDGNHHRDEPPFGSTEMMHQNLNQFFSNHVDDHSDEPMERGSTERNTDGWEEDQTIPLEDEADDFFRLYHERANQKLKNKRDDSVVDGNKQTLRYLKDNISKIKESVLAEGERKTAVKRDRGEEVSGASGEAASGAPRDAANEMLRRWNQALTGGANKREGAAQGGLGTSRGPAGGGRPDWARYLDEAEGEDDEEEQQDEQYEEEDDDEDNHYNAADGRGRTPGRHAHRAEGKAKPADLHYVNEKERKKKLKRRNIFREDEQVEEDLPGGRGDYGDEQGDGVVGDDAVGDDAAGDSLADDSLADDSLADDDAAGERSFFNVKKELRHIISQNLSMNLPKDEEKCIEEASKLFGDDIKTWNEKMYHYFGDRDNVPLDGFDVYDEDEFRNNLVGKGVQEFSEYNKLLDAQQLDVTSERDFLGATYGGAGGPDGSGPTGRGPIGGDPTSGALSGDNLADPVSEGTSERGSTSAGIAPPPASTTQQAKLGEAPLEDDLESYLSTFVDEEGEHTDQKQHQKQHQAQHTQEKTHTQKGGPDLLPPKGKVKGEKTPVGESTDERASIWRDEIDKGGCLENGATRQPSDDTQMNRGDSNEGANSPAEEEINVADIVNKAINIGNLFRRKELAKLMQRRKTQESEGGGGADAGGGKFPRGGDEQCRYAQGFVENPQSKPFLRVSKIVKYGDKEGTAPLEVKEQEKQNQNGKSNGEDDAMGSTLQEDHDELKPYRHASYEVLGYYKRKRKMRTFHELEAVEEGNDEDVILNEQDLLSKPSEDIQSDDKRDPHDEGKKKELLNIDRQMDLLFLHGQEDNLTGGNYVEKLLGEEKYKNKSANKEIDFLIRNYRYVNEHPDELIQNYYSSKGGQKNTPVDLPNGEVKNRLRGIPNGGVYKAERGEKLPTVEGKGEGKTHTARSTDFNIKQTNGTEAEANHLSDESLALRSWAFKLGLLKEEHMHLDDQSLINLFVRNHKFRRALKCYGIKNVQNVSIPLIYKITKLLYFERPFPRKEQTRKLNMD